MGLHDRPYWRDEQPRGHGGPGGPGGMTIGLPRPGKAVKYLLIVNVVVFVLQIVLDQPREGYRVGVLSAWFGATCGAFWQVWRYVTFQFLHSLGGIWHLALNMLGLYMLGAPLEQRFGTRWFLRFYLSCGAFAGLTYVVMAGAIGLPPDIPIIGSSGGVYGVVLACAILFPNFRLILLLFPVPIRLAAALIFGGMILVILRSLSSGVYGPQFWSDVAHLGGAVCAGVWIWALPGIRGAMRDSARRINKGAWERKLKKRTDQTAEVDRILQKIHDHGIGSLTTREKKALQEATSRQRDDERRIRGM